jgi:hypothetical protein
VPQIKRSFLISLGKKDKKEERKLSNKQEKNIESVSVGSSSYFIKLLYGKIRGQVGQTRPPDQGRSCLPV